MAVLTTAPDSYAGRRLGAWAQIAGLAFAVALLGIGLESGTARADTALAKPASTDKAKSFAVDYVLRRDGSVEVTQHLTWQFSAGETHHGIERNIQVRAGYQNQAHRFRYYQLSDVAVTSPTGAPTDISITDFGAYKRVRVGSPSRTVTGTQQYIVKFRLAHVVNGFPDHAEFYYNLLDSSNNVRYDTVSATLRAAGPSDRAQCFYGERGSTNRCKASPGDLASFSAGAVEPGQGVSILASLPITAFDPLSPDVRQGDVQASSSSSLSPDTARLLGLNVMGLGVLFPLLAAGLMGALVWTRGRDEQFAGLTPGLSPGAGEQAVTVRGRAPTVAVQLTPPAGVQPGMLGTVLDEEANTVDVSATIVDLATRGYLTMEEIPESRPFSRGDWQLTRADPPPSGPAGAPLRRYEEALLDGIFAPGSRVTLSSLRNRFRPTLDLVQGLMYREVVDRGWFRPSPQAQRGAWSGIGKLVLFGGVAVTFFLGLRSSRLFGDSGLPVSPFLVLGLGLVVAGAVLQLLGKRMAARTAEGSAVLAQSIGFRRYLETAEARQIKFEEAQDIFSRYLPDAIVFGVAEHWAQVFEDVTTSAAAAGHPVSMPLWCIGPGIGSFANMTAGLDSFATTAAGTFVSTPGSSGSSGFSSGSGFSGGGGGGGSGGSW